MPGGTVRIRRPECDLRTDAEKQSDIMKTAVALLGAYIGQEPGHLRVVNIPDVWRAVGFDPKSTKAKELLEGLIRTDTQSIPLDILKTMCQVLYTHCTVQQ